MYVMQYPTNSNSRTTLERLFNKRNGTPRAKKLKGRREVKASHGFIRPYQKLCVWYKITLRHHPVPPVAWFIFFPVTTQLGFEIDIRVAILIFFCLGPKGQLISYRLIFFSLSQLVQGSTIGSGAVDDPS